MPQKWGRFAGNRRKIQADFPGIAANMRKRKKPRQRQKKSLDGVPKQKSLRGRKAARHRQPRRPSNRQPPDENGGMRASALASYLDQLPEPERPKRGRPTIRDNFLLGSRNSWLSFFEEFWPEIGFSLLEIRKQESSAIEDVRKVFEPVKGKDRSLPAEAFWRGTPQPVEGKELRANRIRSSRLRYGIQDMHSQRLELVRSCAEAENALAQAGELEKEIIRTQANQRKQRLLELEEKLPRAENESKELDKKVQDQETYWYCSQLLAFLRKRKYAIEPLNLANALAGLPEMGWYESLARCSRMPRSSSFVQFPCEVFKVVARIWRRRPKELQSAPTEFFRAQILKMPKKESGMRDILCRAWRDLRLAIEECWKAQHAANFMPYAITSAFLRNRLRQKTAAERILDEHEILSRSQAQTGKP